MATVVAPSAMGAIFSRTSRASAVAAKRASPVPAPQNAANNVPVAAQNNRDPHLDSLLSQLDGSITGHAVKVLDEDIEKRLAAAKRDRLEKREEKLLGRINTEEFRRLLQLPALSGGVSREAVRNVALSTGVKEEVLWQVLTNTRVPPLVQRSDGYLVGKSWNAK